MAGTVSEDTQTNAFERLGSAIFLHVPEARLISLIIGNSGGGSSCAPYTGQDGLHRSEFVRRDSLPYPRPNTIEDTSRHLFEAFADPGAQVVELILATSGILKIGSMLHPLPQNGRDDLVISQSKGNHSRQTSFCLQLYASRRRDAERRRARDVGTRDHYVVTARAGE